MPDRESPLAGGASSPVRAGAAVGGKAFVQSAGRGAYAFDAQGRSYIDYVMGYGPLLFGYTHPALSEGLDRLAADGVLFGSTHSEEERLAERIRAHLPSMQRVRLATTGTEAVSGAIRTARAFTGREAVVRFAGNYHGHSDFALLQAGASVAGTDRLRAGIPRGVTDVVRVARYNDLADADRIVGGEWDRVAAVIVEPICANMGLVAPVRGFLEGLRERTRSARALLIFDEVITWLRLGLGGAQQRLGIEPDVTVVGKVLGGGYPIAAFGGRTDVMAMLAPTGAVFSGGTHAGNPLCVAIAHRVLDLLEGEEIYAAMRRRAEALAAGLRAHVDRLGFDYAVSALESIVDFKFRSGPPPRNFEEAQSADSAAFARYYHAMRARGVLLPPSQNEVMFLSSAHGDADIETTLAAAGESLRALVASPKEG